ncbi:hypothetical protein TTRE_0000832501 [Trichuris trichiura]|uniref:Uncharacterized protein n=1 Tax=Trichuris trichiura TaxID=36087 RepID=A0A077ZJW0_TRITR|nr:hypothetical protein TTRE_0000832501 [Trichuris trichiura]
MFRILLAKYFFLLWVTLLISGAFGRKQRVQVKGKLVCGDKPASKVTVKLIERGSSSFINFALLASSYEHLCLLFDISYLILLTRLCKIQILMLY